MGYLPACVRPLGQTLGISLINLTVKQHFVSTPSAALAKVLVALNSCSIPQLLDSAYHTQQLCSWLKEALLQSMPQLRQPDPSPDTCLDSQSLQRLKAACDVMAEGRCFHHLVVMTLLHTACLRQFMRIVDCNLSLTDIGYTALTAQQSPDNLSANPWHSRFYADPSKLI
jgi:hypothetical protein